MVLLLSLSFNIWLGISYANKARTVAEIANQYPLLDPARDLHRQDDLIVNFQPLRDQVRRLVGDRTDISIYFQYLNTGATIVENKDAEFYPASLLKLPAAMAATKKVENGDWEWTTELVLKESEKDKLWGELYSKPVGTRIPLTEIIRQILVESDNTAYRMLVHSLKASELQGVYDHLGLGSFAALNTKLSAKRYAVVLRALYHNTYLSAENSQRLLDLLTTSHFGDYLGSGLPKDVRWAHKIGLSEQAGVFLDAGIVYLPERPYVIIAMIRSKDEAAAKKFMGELSQMVYKFVADYKPSNDD